MKLQKILISFIFIIFSLFVLNTSFWAINMTISPIKYELTASTWATITREAKLTNHTDSTIHIVTWKSDFIANWENWVPRFIRKSEVVYEQELSDWIVIDTPEFNIDPEETKTITFTINVPDNATPGWHYWAVFFKNNNSEQSAWTSVWINIDYWVLILLNIDWDVNSEIEIWEPIITGHSGRIKHMDVCNEMEWDKSWNYYDWKCSLNGENNSSTWTISQTWTTNNEIIISKEDNEKDDCIVDLTSSEYDKKCIDNFDKIISDLTWDIENTDLNTDNLDNNDFKIQIVIPVENKWNTHVKPKWKITLIDEKWNQIKKVWKKVITNDKWAIIWEKIVDYIPFNDQWGNILPWTKRIYDWSWKWFPHQEINEDWEKEMFYWDPSEYYSKENLKKHTLIFPWQRICEREQNKIITAKFNINYPDENWENIEYNSAKDFKVKYTEKYIWLNPYFFFALFSILFWFWILWLLFRKKKKVCINPKCNKKIDKDMKICPYCGTKQNNTTTKSNNKETSKKSKSEKKTDNKKPIIIAAKKQKLKTKQLELNDKIKNILIENKLKYAENITKLQKQEILKIKWIWEVALKQIQKALKKEKMKIKK